MKFVNSIISNINCLLYFFIKCFYWIRNLFLRGNNNSIFRFDFVEKVKSKNIDQKNKQLILELIAIDYMKNKDDYEINLIFKNNAHIALTTETIEVRLEDQNEIKE